MYTGFNYESYSQISTNKSNKTKGKSNYYEGQYGIQIMNGYECQWYRYFHEVRDGMFYSTRQSQVE